MHLFKLYGICEAHICLNKDVLSWSTGYLEIHKQAIVAFRLGQTSQMFEIIHTKLSFTLCLNVCVNG